MKLHHQHPWNVSVAEARAIQLALADRVIRNDRFRAIHSVAGVDVGFENANRTARAAVAVLRLPDLEAVTTAIARRPATFPYVPGLLSFREVPCVLDALARLAALPDLLICDGQGIAHPRRFGIACHLGVLTGLPSIGVAKTRLIGHHREVPDERGAWTPLFDAGERIGAVLRTRPGVRPVFVSIGHRVSLETAIDYVMRCTTRYRLPETTRVADRLASQR